MADRILPISPTSHDFLIAFFPDHELHTITEVDEPTTKDLTFYCSCGQHLGIQGASLEGYMSAENIIKKGALKSCIIKPKPKGD